MESIRQDRSAVLGVVGLLLYPRGFFHGGLVLVLIVKNS